MPQITAEMPFSQACRIWLETHSQYVQPSTLRVYNQYAKSLAKFFSDRLLHEFEIGQIRAYQSARKEQVNPEMVNSEIGSVLVPILAEVERWPLFAKVYRPLPVPPKRVRQSMTEDEMRRLIAVALVSSKPRRLLAGHCLLVMANTGMGFGELKHLRRHDVVLNEKESHVTVNEGLKNPYRQRVLPLNWIALRSMLWIVKRWQSLGGSAPDQFILPHCARYTAEQRLNLPKKRLPIFSEPMLTMSNAARKILDEAGLKHLHIYDMRSHFATKIMEDPEISESEAGEWIGHSKVAKEINRRYFAPKMKKMIKAVAKVAPDPEPVPQQQPAPIARSTGFYLNSGSTFFAGGAR